MAVVTFNLDVSPYCKGDVVNLTDAEKKRVDELVKQRNLESAYSVTKSEKPAPTK